MSNVSLDFETAYRPDRRVARALGYSLYLTFSPHSQNSDTRKRVTTILFLTWAAASLLKWTGHAEPADNVYWPMTVIVFSIISHLWGFEYGVLTALVNDGSGVDVDPPEPVDHSGGDDE